MSAWSLKKSVQSFIDYGFKDGDIVSHDWFCYTLDVKETGNFLWLERFKSLESALLKDHKIALQNVRGVGYRIVPPNEQAFFAAEEAAKYIQKGMVKSENLLSNTRINSLTTEERRRHVNTQVRMAALSDMVKSGKRDVFALFKDKAK